jgi:hypothetical protein
MNDDLLRRRDEAYRAAGIRIPVRSGAPRPTPQTGKRPAWLAFVLRTLARLRFRRGLR